MAIEAQAEPEVRMGLEGKVAIITGGSSGLGAAFAVGLATAGADVAVGARRADLLAETASAVEASGRRCLAVATDVTDPEHCNELVEATMKHFGRVDILVNNAGQGTAIPATRESPAGFRAVYEVNLFGSYWMAQACARVMEPGSSIIMIGSTAGSASTGLPQAAYVSSKSALIGLTKDLAQQWSGRKGIRVNLLAPGIIASGMHHQLPREYVDTVVASRVAMDRAGDPAEVVSALVFLASEASSYVTGVTLPVDGGLLA